MKITLAIPTYNRLEYIKNLSKSLYGGGGGGESSGGALSEGDFKKVNIKIYDDCSSDYDLATLKDLFPTAKRIVRNFKNLKADRNSAVMFLDFLDSDDDVIINADSDMIFRPGFVDEIIKFLPHTNGALSLYNSRLHVPLDSKIKPISLQENALIEKKDIGSAGAVFTKAVVREIIEQICGKLCDFTLKEPNDECIILESGRILDKNILLGVKGLDWQWSELLYKNGTRLFCLQNSYAQHLGILGQHHAGWLHGFDYGLNFTPVSRANSEILSKFIEDMIAQNELAINRSKTHQLSFFIQKVKRSLRHRVKRVFRIFVPDKETI